MAKNQPTAKQLAEEIWDLVERHQGKAFISDGLIAAKSRRQVFAVVRGSLAESKIVVRKTRAFLRKYGQE